MPPFDCHVAMKVLAEELLQSNNQNGTDTTIGSVNDDEDVNRTILSVFEEMPKLVASASLGQVYKAKLLRDSNNNHHSSTSESNQEVAIKIQRPDIFETVTLDLYLLLTYGKTVDKLCSLLTNQIPYHEKFLNGFSSGAFMELNYCNEAENQMYFRKVLGERFNGSTTTTTTSLNDKNNETKHFLSFLRTRRKSNAADKVIIPKVYQQYTTERILVTEWITGYPLARAPPEQIRELIPVGVELFLCQLLDIGKFHADPHPGE